MDINRANLENLMTLFESKFSGAYNNANDAGILEQIVMVMDSTTSSHDHNWLEQIGVMREWVADREIQNVASNSFTEKNLRWEQTIEIPRVDIEDDRMSHYDLIFSQRGQEAVNFKVRETIAKMIANPDWGGDKSPFFQDSRTYGTQTIDNISTNALNATEFNTAYDNMSSYLGHSGEPLEVTPTLLVHGPSLRTTVFDILQNQNIPNSQASIQNANMGIVKSLQSARLTGVNANKWFLLGETSGLKGIIWQERIAPEIQDSRTDPNSDFVFISDNFQVGIRARGVPVLAIPHLAYFGDVAA